MRQWGATDAQINQELARHIETVDIFHENELAYEIYCSLNHSPQATLGGVFYQPVSRSEIADLMRDVYQVPKELRIDTLDRIKVLERRALKHLNARS